jgi:hypothetical protein
MMRSSIYLFQGAQTDPVAAPEMERAEATCQFPAGRQREQKSEAIVFQSLMS